MTSLQKKKNVSKILLSNKQLHFYTLSINSIMFPHTAAQFPFHFALSVSKNLFCHFSRQQTPPSLLQGGRGRERKEKKAEKSP
jgi:hypothetical protein